MKRTTEIAIDSFLDGFTGAGLFGRLRRPGAPTEFVDSRSVQEIPDKETAIDATSTIRGPLKPSKGIQIEPAHVKHKATS